MRYDAVLFDLDGTITESEPGIVNSVKYAIEKLGGPAPSPETLRRFIGPPLKHAFEQLTGLSARDAERAVALYRERFREVGWKENSVYPGMTPLLRTLKARGVYVALATAKPYEFSRRIAEYFGFAAYLDHLEAVDFNNHDADKRALVRAALPARFERACMVGDRSYDMDGAKGNGIEAIGALYGYGSREELTAARADFIAEDVDALTNRLLDGEPLAPGALITLEGPDGCGKSTQTTRLANFLRQCGWRITVTREPGGCPIAESIRELVLSADHAEMTPLCEALLFTAARAQHVSELIRPAIARGELVLCDRFVDSSVAYQGAGRGLGIDLVQSINAPAVSDCAPLGTLFFDVDPLLAIARRKASASPDRIERETPEFLRRVYDGYRELLRREPARIRRVAADGSREDVFEAARECLTALLAGK